jgi:hypothetical protein
MCAIAQKQKRGLRILYKGTRNHASTGDPGEQPAMKRYSRTGAALATATLALATVFLVAGGSVSQAKPQKAEKSPKAAFTAMQSGGGKPAEGLDAATTAAIGKGEDGSCFTARKKLWVEDEGWIVRRVTTCR